MKALEAWVSSWLGPIRFVKGCSGPEPPFVKQQKTFRPDEFVLTDYELMTYIHYGRHKNS